MLETWIRNFTHAARSLARAPGFTLIVVATLALAIGANTAIFSVVNAVLLEPLPFPHADRLVHIAGTAPGTDQPAELGVPDELYFEYRESVPALEDIGLYGTGSSTSRAEGHVDQLFLTQATPSVFTTLGAQPLLCHRGGSGRSLRTGLLSPRRPLLMLPSMRLPVVKPPVIFTLSNKLPPEQAP